MSNWQYSNIGSDNGLAPNRQQVIIWTNDDSVQRCIYASLGLSELIHDLVWMEMSCGDEIFDRMIDVLCI